MLWLAIPELPVAGVVDITSGSAAVLLGFSGLLGGTAHYGAVLARLPQHEVEITTATGFFCGIFAGLVVLLLEALS